MNNLRLKLFKEGEQRGELKGIILKWIQDLCPDLDISINHIDWCHHMGSNQGKSRLRDILVRFAFYTTKLEVYNTLSKIQDLNYEGEKMEVYQDLAFKIRQKRKNWKDYTQILWDNEIK